jgi:hypothetical protein
MPISVARKLQALRDLKYPSLDIEVFPVALTLEQVRLLGLPSTPLKETERRADHWRVKMQHEQTEIDALAALDPATLHEIAWTAIEPFYDRTLARRVDEYRREWAEEANRALRTHPSYTEICERLEAGLEALRSAAENFDTVQQVSEDELSNIGTPPLNPPKAELSTQSPRALFTTKDGFAEATRRLIRHKRLDGIYE